MGTAGVRCLPGLVIGVVSMILLVVYHAGRPHLSALGRVAGVHDEDYVFHTVDQVVGALAEP
jgi:hypothetical protein